MSLGVLSGLSYDSLEHMKMVRCDELAASSSHPRFVDPMLGGQNALDGPSVGRLVRLPAHASSVGWRLLNTNANTGQVYANARIGRLAVVLLLAVAVAIGWLAVVLLLAIAVAIGWLAVVLLLAIAVAIGWLAVVLPLAVAVAVGWLAVVLLLAVAIVGLAVVVGVNHCGMI